MKNTQSLALAIIASLMVGVFLMLSIVATNLDTIAKEQHKQTLIGCINLRENGADSISKIDREACGD